MIRESWLWFFISEIPEDPLVAEEYYADVFDSCSEESEEEEEETMFSGSEEEDIEEEPQLSCRTNQQVSAASPELVELFNFLIWPRLAH